VGEVDDNLEHSQPHDPGIAETKRMVRDPLTYVIIGAAQKVHRTLGPGFRESSYQQALAKELLDRKIPFASQPEYEVVYEGVVCGTYRPDIVVDASVVLELKAISALSKEHMAQTISYLKAAGLRTALLINFGAPSLQWRRFRN